MGSGGRGGVDCYSAKGTGRQGGGQQQTAAEEQTPGRRAGWTIVAPQGTNGGLGGRGRRHARRQAPRGEGRLGSSDRVEGEDRRKATSIAAHGSGPRGGGPGQPVGGKRRRPGGGAGSLGVPSGHDPQRDAVGVHDRHRMGGAVEAVVRRRTAACRGDCGSDEAQHWHSDAAIGRSNAAAIGRGGRRRRRDRDDHRYHAAAIGRSSVAAIGREGRRRRRNREGCRHHAAAIGRRAAVYAEGRRRRPRGQGKQGRTVGGHVAGQTGARQVRGG